jgi:hypothetical protein
VKIVLNAGDGDFSLSARAFELYSALRMQRQLPTQWTEKLWEGGVRSIRPHCLRELDRADSDLIAVVEKLGLDAGGPDVQFHVLDVPDGAAWKIRDVCGIEYAEINGKPIM